MSPSRSSQLSKGSRGRNEAWDWPKPSRLLEHADWEAWYKQSNETSAPTGLDAQRHS